MLEQQLQKSRSHRTETNKINHIFLILFIQLKQQKRTLTHKDYALKHTTIVVHFRP